METSELRRRRIKQNRRKERAEKVEKERSEVTNDDPDDDNVGPPVKKPRRKPRKPCAEEDIIDGFSILAFKTFDDLTRAITVGSEESDPNKQICVQLKSSQEGGDNKTINADKNIKKPTTNCTFSTQQFKENGEIMVDKVPRIDVKTTAPSSGNPYPHPKKLGRLNGPSSKDALHNLICEDDDIGDKISDGCSDLFAAAPPRKDSSPNLPDNLHSSNIEPKGVDIQRHQNNENKPSSPPSATTVNSIPTQVTQVKSRIEPLDASIAKPQTNGPDSRTEDVNGFAETSPGAITQPPPPPPVQRQKPTVPQTLFTPYAITAITKVSVSTPIAPVVPSQSCIPESPHDQNQSHPAHIQHSSHSQRINRNHISVASNFNYNVQSSGDLTSPGPPHIRHSTSPVVEKIVQSKPCNSSSPVLGQSRKSLTPSGKVTPTTTTSKSAAFGSIARLLDSPSTSRSSPTVNATVTTSTNYNSFNHHHQSFGGGLLNGSSSHNQNSAQVTCSSRSHSPRGHSPSRERDSYSSNVSSLSNTSVNKTPVSGSSSQLPPTLSPLQNLQSYSKAASWLSTVPGLSPRPTPPPPHSSSSSTGLISGSSQYSPGAPLSISGPLSISAGTAPSPQHSVFPGLVPGAPHPPHSSAAMFAPPILPLSSISQHPTGHPSPFGPDALFHGSSTSSELVRRDLESRFLSSERNLAGGPSFMTRGDLHPHHHMLPPLSGVNHLPPQSPGGAHSTLFPPPLFKDLPKIGLDSPFYRTNMAMSYPGFNGILPPNLATPFAPPNQIAAFTPKITDACKPAKVMKSGRWNAMHVRIAWEIYHDQQKGGGGGEHKNRNSSSPANHSAKGSVLVSTANSSSNPIAPPPPPPNPSVLGVSASELLRQPPQHVFGLSRPPDVGPSGPPPFSASLLSPHHTAPPPSPHSMFLNSAPHLGMPRYPGFSGLGPAAYSGLLSRELPSLALVPNAQEHWHRSHRGPPLGTGWPVPMQRSERDVKTPNESRRHKEDRSQPRAESHHTTSESGRDLSPFRDRSPVRPGRTPLENGDDSRSSDSHSVHTSSNFPSMNKSGRTKEETNGDVERDKILHQLSNDSKHQSLISATHPSRLFHPQSPMTTPITSSWDAFPGMMGTAPRMSSAESFRLSLLQLSERERELSRIPHAQMRPLFSNGPFALGMGHPGSSGNSKNHPSMSIAAAAAAAHNHLLHSSSPKHDEMNPAPIIRTKEESQSR